MAIFQFPFFSGKKQQNTEGETSAQHRQEREQFQRVLEAFDASRIEERLLVLDLFLSIPEHLSLSVIEEQIRERRPDLLDREFLKESMELFCRFGFARKLEFDDREAVYEHRHLGLHHDHFICVRCGGIEEFNDPEIEQRQMEIARQFSFHPLQHKMEIYGICAACMARRTQTLPLYRAANGEQVRVVRVDGDREMRMRLIEMGFVEGEVLEVVSNSLSGPVIVALKGARLAINAELAGKIVVAHLCR